MDRRIMTIGAAAVLAHALCGITTAQAADTWTVNHDESRLGFVGLQGGAEFTGHFGVWEAEIAFDPADLENSSVVVTIATESADAGASQRNDLLPGSEWFDVAAHPQARFVTTGFTHLGGTDYEATAELTIRDMTHEVVLPFSLVIDGDTAEVSGELGILRTDYDVGIGQWASADPVAFEVRVTVDLAAQRGG